MQDQDKPTDASAVELTETDLDGVQGGFDGNTPWIAKNSPTPTARKAGKDQTDFVAAPAQKSLFGSDCGMGDTTDQ